MIFRLENSIRNYAWGARDGIANFLGQVNHSTEPEAELWIGAHADNPSRVWVKSTGPECNAFNQAILLNDFIAAAPNALLGADVCKRFTSRLPYLLKVLAAGQPLSLQAHPTLEQAQSGFDDEERRHVPRDAQTRNYRDRNHKPELIFATTPFEAFCGFRSVSETIDSFERLGQPLLLPLSRMLRAEPNATGTRAVLEQLLVTPTQSQRQLVEQTLAAAEQGQSMAGPDQSHLRWIAKLGRIYPGDVGVVTALMLNYVYLEVGQAMFLPAQTLHSYLSGVGIEIMASSDNVLRGGLTPKHVDATELLRVLTFEPLPPPIVTPTTVSQVERAFLTPAADFRLSQIQLGSHPSDNPILSHKWEPLGPELLLCSEGHFNATAEGQLPLTLTRGQSVFVGADSRSVLLEGHGTVFRATVGST